MTTRWGPPSEWHEPGHGKKVLAHEAACHRGDHRRLERYLLEEEPGPHPGQWHGRTAIAIEHVAVFIDGKKVDSAQLPCAIDEHLSNCISRRVLGWQFPVASEPTRIDLPFVFAEPQ